MKKKFTAGMLALALVFSFPLGLAGCSASVEAENLMEGVRAKAAETPAQTDGREKVAITDFAVKTLQGSVCGGENILLSPVSLLSALAMTANGARDETLSQMEEVFGLSLEEINTYLQAYQNNLPTGEKYKVSLANSIWFREDDRLQVKEDFLQANADFYGADIYKAPFDNSTLKAVNNWVSEKTDGMIENILNEIRPEDIMYLLNALSFDAEWQNIYYDYQVQDGVFTAENGEERAIKLMYSDEYTYLVDGQAQGLMKYYADQKYAFAALLPNEGIGLEEYIAGLTGEKLAETLENAEEVPVKAAIPQFESEYFADMGKLLIQMGMPDAFDADKADFTGIGLSGGGENNIFISNVYHKTYISVNEKGTRAGAATVVATTDSAALIEEVKTVYLDRPFVYMLIDCEKNIPLFIGCIQNLG